MQPIDINKLLSELFDTMPVWLPVLAIALKLNVPGLTSAKPLGKDKGG